MYSFGTAMYSTVTHCTALQCPYFEGYGVGSGSLQDDVKSYDMAAWWHYRHSGLGSTDGGIGST